MSERLGDRALRFARPHAAPARILEAVRGWPGVRDVVIGGHDVAIYFDSEPNDDHDARIAELATLPIEAPLGREHEIRVIYDGEDLAAVAAATRMTIADVVAAHVARTYEVASIGFLPGFAYLDGLDPRLELPRRETPRPRVPAGALAIAGAQTAVYPFASPGGWHLIGRVIDGRMFTAEHGARLGFGDRVRFVA
ncbi:MAG: carboxyltransferase domain-containing protein [Deltaproteobacteria bacterium]